MSGIRSDHLADRSWVIVGCGYTGTYLARRLRDAGAEVWITRRSPDALAAARAAIRDLAPDAAPDADPEDSRDGRLHERVVDLADPATLAGWLPDGAIIVDSAPPVRGAGGTDDAGAAERALVAAASRARAARIVYISSTGVYPPGDGGWIDEDSPVGPTSERGEARLAAESALLDAAAARGVEAVSLRAAGIYGPGRGVYARIRAGRYRVVGAGDTHVNRIHVIDLVAVIARAATVPSLPRAVYLVADGRPETARVHADAVADALGVPRPPSVPESAVEPWVRAMLGANRRVSNTRMLAELGVTLAYPSWREALAENLAADAGR